jgi:hypothetical protein
MKPADIFANAERLISDARLLHQAGRSRSAATLTVVALEQLGAYVEDLTREKYPEAVVHMGIFGDRANAHAKRQDALTAHVLSIALGRATTDVLFEIFFRKTGCGDREKYVQWFLAQKGPIQFTPEQQDRINNGPDMRTAKLLMKSVRTSQLQHLREFGLYENVAARFSDDEIGEAISLAERVRVIMESSADWVVPETVQIAGINMPDEIVLGSEVEPGGRRY